jgi:hypothetical protein
MIVDSCIDAATGKPAATRYLEEIGVDYAKDVAVVLATHWHDDHVRGLGAVLEACESAKFVYPTALQAKEFLVLVESRATGTERLSSGVREFAEILAILRTRKESGSSPGSIKQLVLESSVIYNSTACEVIALSPSSAAVEQALGAIAQMLPERLQPHLRVRAPKQNAASVALWITGASGAALLGADLEVHDSDDHGWGAALQIAPSEVARLVKVPHHGGKTGHDQRMWEQMLAPEPDAMLTPWSLGGKSLPTEDDVHRICGLAPEAVIAGQASSKPERFDRAVDRTLNEVAISRRAVGDRTGHIRARCAPTDSGRWSVEMIHEARRLCT